MYRGKKIRFAAAVFLLALDMAFTVIIWTDDATDRKAALMVQLVIAAALAVMIFRTAGNGTQESGTELPGYWRRHLKERIPAIRKKDAETEDHGDSFIFITDLHYNANDGYSAGAAAYILAHSDVCKVIIGGDLCNGSSGSRQACISQITNCRNAFAGMRPFYLRGNHDNNTEISERTSEKTISDSELYDMILKPVGDRIVPDRGLRYYFHNEAQKIRYICLDTGHPDWFVIDDEQIAWMQDRIRELPYGWTAVVLTHQFYDSDLSRDGNGEKILAGLNAIHDEVNAVIACVICGHSHADHMEISEKGFPVICTTCDTRGGECGGLKRTFHTPAEQAFDVFHIDTATRKIYATRIGAGEDRQASY